MKSKLDPRGYYASLEVSPNATEREIKDAYRRLAKKYHPDLNAAEDAKREFQKVNEAYQVLGSADSRANYDAAAYEQHAAEKEGFNGPPPEPIKCSMCSRPTAQPRYVIFERVTALLLYTVRTPIQGIFCHECAGKKAIWTNIYNSLLGWWSPHGIFWTLASMVRNATGGRQDKMNNERLAFASASIFMLRGQFDLAYAIAKPLRHSAVDKFSDGARFICQLIEREQLADTSRELKDPWRFSVGVFIKSVAPGIAAVLLVVGGIFYHDLLSLHRTGSPAYRPEISPSPTLASQTARPAPSLNTAGLTPIPSNQPGCVPANGAILGGYYKRQANGHSVEIKNGSANSAVVKLRDSSGATFLSFFVQKGETATVPGIRDGQFRIQFAFVDSLSSDCRTLAKVKGAQEFPGTELFRTKYTGDYVEYSRLSLTLYSVAGGNVKPKGMDIAAFNQD